VFGLDQWLAGASDGTTLAIVVLAALALGLRHASDPDHLTAVTSLVASRSDHSARAAGSLGLAWGGGHATSLFLLGLPIVLYRAYLPELVQRGAEALVGVVIVALAVGLLVRSRPGAHLHERPTRSSWQAYGIGVLHGVGGSAGVGVLLLSSVPSRWLALVSLAVFAAGTALSMAALSTGLGMTLAGPLHRWFHRLTPVLGLASLCFGVWYTLSAGSLLPSL
jgi:high-affinity nickel permease